MKLIGYMGKNGIQHMHRLSYSNSDFAPAMFMINGRIHHPVSMTTIGARGCDVTDVSLHEEVLGSLTQYKHLAITLDLMGRQGAESNPRSGVVKLDSRTVVGYVTDSFLNEYLSSDWAQTDHMEGMWIFPDIGNLDIPSRLYNGQNFHLGAGLGIEKMRRLPYFLAYEYATDFYTAQTILDHAYRGIQAGLPPFEGWDPYPVGYISGIVPQGWSIRPIDRDPVSISCFWQNSAE